MLRKGSNKLVRQMQQQQQVICSNDDARSSVSSSGGSNGKDKNSRSTGVGSPSAKTASSSQPSNHHNSNNNNNLCYNRKKKSTLKLSPRPQNSTPKAKRIKLSNTTPTAAATLPAVNDQSSSTGSEEGSDGGSNPNPAAAAAVPKGQQKSTEGKKFTDFAYHETSKQIIAGRGRHRNGERRKNMGLKRLQQDTSKIPICPIFLHGKHCTNPTCLKRHDVPKEFSVPICSFFQRQGMCLKDDCPFRHIKVNPLATPCPSFELLGYCDDKDCTLLHSRPPKKRKLSPGQK